MNIAVFQFYHPREPTKYNSFGEYTPHFGMIMENVLLIITLFETLTR